jgi:hypothetical protein
MSGVLRPIAWLSWRSCELSDRVRQHLAALSRQGRTALQKLVNEGTLVYKRSAVWDQLWARQSVSAS